MKVAPKDLEAVRTAAFYSGLELNFLMGIFKILPIFLIVFFTGINLCSWFPSPYVRHGLPITMIRTCAFALGIVATAIKVNPGAAVTLLSISMVTAWFFEMRLRPRREQS